MQSRLFFLAGLILLAPTAGHAQDTGAPLAIEVVPNVPHTFEALALSPDGSRLVTGGYDGSVQVWDFAIGRLLRSLARHSKQVRSVMFVAEGRQVLSASEDMTIKLWDGATGRLLRTTELRSPAEYWWDLALSPDGKRALSSQTIKGMYSAKLWDVETGQVLRTFRVSAMDKLRSR